MKNRKLAVIGVILMLSIGNYSRIKGNDNIRPIQFLSILAIGLLGGVLISEVAAMMRLKNGAK